MNQQVKVQAARNVLNKYLTQFKDQIAAALPKHLTVDRMTRLALTAFNQNQKLANCTPESIFASIIVSSQLGLEVGILGHGYLVPYKETCTFIPGWQGYVELVNRAGQATVRTGCVYEGDIFDFELGTNSYIKHKPMGEDDPSKILFTYAIGQLKSGGDPTIEVWPARKIWKHRDKYNKVGQDHYSFKHPEMYARKIPLLQVIKYLPKSVEMQNAMNVETAALNGQLTTYINGEYTVETEAPAEGPAVSAHDIDTSTGEVFEQEGSPAFLSLRSLILKTKDAQSAEAILNNQLMKKATNEEREKLASMVSNRIKAIDAGMIG